MTDLTHYTEGVCADGAAILRDGVMMPIEEIVSELNRLTALAQPEPAGDDGDVAIDRWIESRPDWPNNWPAVTQCQLNALIGEALEHWGRPARAALSADGPAVPESREPASVVNKPSDEDLWGLDQLEETWNAQADAFNNWNELGLDEIIVWAQRQALSRWGYHPAPPAEGEVGTLVSWLVGQAIRAADADQSKDAGMLTWAAQIIGERVDEDAITNKPTDEDLYDLAEVFNGDPVPAMRRALELWGRPAAPPAPAPEMVPVAVSDALIKAECSLSDIAEGEETIAAPNTFEWAEQRCAETLAIIRPVMTQHGIRTSEWPPQQLSAPAPAVVPVPVSERPWERNGWCDECGFFWAEHISRSDIPSWRYTCANDLGGWATRCLPFHALPLPQAGEVQP